MVVDVLMAVFIFVCLILSPIITLIGIFVTPITTHIKRRKENSSRTNVFIIFICNLLDTPLVFIGSVSQCLVSIYIIIKHGLTNNLEDNENGKSTFENLCESTSIGRFAEGLSKFAFLDNLYPA